MIIRYLSSAGIGIAVTTGLLWTMNALIDMGKPVVTETRTRHYLEQTKVRDDTRVQTVVKPPERVQEPRQPPATKPPVEPGTHTTPVGTKSRATTPAGPTFGQGIVGNIDSGLINIIHAQPVYPDIAIGRGLEGYVVVQFDVTELGTIENVEVVETSSSIFNKAAVNAAYRSKYKPKTVDGVSYRSEGVKKVYRFEMDDSN